MTDEAGEIVAGQLRPGADAGISAAPGRWGISRRWWLRLGFLAVWGPGLVVMLADTDAGR